MEGIPSFLLRHGDKVVAGSFAAWLLYALALPLVSTPKALQERERLAEGLAQIDDHIRNFEPVEVASAPPALPGLRHELDPGSVPEAESLGSWLIARRPSFLYEIVKPPACPLAIHGAPTNVRVTKVEHHKVGLSWSLAPSNRFVKIAGTEIQRQDVPGGPWKNVGRVDPDHFEFVDETAPAWSTVTYRLDERAQLDTDDAAIPPTMPPLADSVALASAVSPPASTPRDFFVAVESGAPADPLQAGFAAQAHATLKVFAWTPTGFVKNSYRDVVAEKTIGQLEPAFRVGRNQTVKIDFTTGAVLKDVSVVKRPIPGGGGATLNKVVATIEWPNGKTEELVQGENPDLK